MELLLDLSEIATTTKGKHTWFRLTGRLASEARSDNLTSEAHRLAWAVLHGDTEASLLLADEVQMTYQRRVTAETGRAPADTG